MSMMKSENIRSQYLSVGANRHTAVADWSHDGVIAFGADSNIAIWRPHDPIPRGITSLLSGHKDVVKAIKFLPHTEYLLSGADDHCLKIWVLTSDGRATCIQTLQEHTAAINCIAVLPSKSKPDTSSQQPSLFATGAADASIKIWSFDGKEAKVLQTVKPSPKYFPLSIALSILDQESKGESALVLAAAGTRDIVQIFVSDSTETPGFNLQVTLTGHEGWIRSLDFAWEASAPDSDLILASASQDKYLRLWRIHRGTDLPAAAAANAGDPSLGAYLPGKSPSNKAHKLKAGGQDFTATFEALLLGHDDWIYSAKWYYSSSNSDRKLQLLSTSADNTLAIWEADPASGIWVTNVRLGEISREKGATTATGSTGGFWTGLWSPDGRSVTCLGRTGSWRLWDYDQDQDHWSPRVGLTGHTRPVTGIAWAKNGDYLLSTSSDQTTRLHANWKRDNTEQEQEQLTWHEISRPQIHGYDLNCIDVLGNSQFVSGADEKLMRVFDEPKAVAKLLSRLCGIEDDSTRGIEEMPDAANMPVLGLSNKAIDIRDADDNVGEETNGAEGAESSAETEALRKSALEIIDHPPLEDSLSRYTLWPEAEKLYGHGYELSCLAASHDGRLIASACKASSINHAVIRIFETQRWTEIKPPLTAHSLTVTRLRFSADDRYLLSVGRDRQWAVFERATENGNDGETSTPSYQLLQSNPKGHTRMILDAAWAPFSSSPTEPDSIVFATAGRDKQVKIWRKAGANSEISCVATITETHPVTAIDFKRSLSNDGSFVLAVGNEAGKISVHSINPASLEVVSSTVLPPE
ncbi:elongator complex protein [Xylariaceae sp. FL0255]|nr:elongator complex protein [Xylariaceae sp. FL0255]